MKRQLSLVLCLSLLCSMLIGVPMLTNAATERTDKVWYEADFDDGTLDDPFHIRNNYDIGGPTADYGFADDGNGGKALHITNRTTNYGGLEIDVSEMVKNTEIQDGEGYSMGFRMKAEEGEKFWLRVELYDPKNAGGDKVGNGYLWSIESYFLITDEWTPVPLGQYFFTSDYDSGRGWANSAVSGNIGFVTFDCGDNDVRGDSNTAGFYIDDVQVSAPYDQAQAVAAFVAAVQALPAAGEVAHEDGGAIDSALAMYEDLSTYTGLNLKAVQQAKAVLDEIKAAYDALGSENPDPEKEPPYTETFNSQAVGPVQGDEGPVQGLEIANDPAESRDGSNYLHVVQRNAVEESPFFYHNVNKEIADQGTGTY